MHEFTKAGHDILIERGAGIGSGILDDEYEREGAKLSNSAPEIFENAEMIMSNKINIEHEISFTDVIIGTVLRPGAKTPKLITREMLGLMKPGTVVIDVSIDQGGCIETSRPTTHSNPVHAVDGIIHYCVANMPGAYPRSSTFALTNATLPFGLQIANLGWKKAARMSQSIAKGINVAAGSVICRPVAVAHGLKHALLENILQ
ncbi:MAG: hypothetical protein A2176_00985 [Spirochaetes bacterium RBG_13_51_14]|nr:MAG: hypothetical protein A2176_00985 [Spirochaetes bacterium RBG_13_51_14]